jgi:type II secretory pathway pseudopilin PulG
LVVVLILAALAGVLIPVLTNMTTRAHGSSGSANIAEIAKAVQTHQALYNASPNGFDSLLEGDGTAAPTDIVTDVALNPLGGGDLIFADLGTPPAGIDGTRIAEALNDLGINTTYVHNPTTGNRTFEPYYDGDANGLPDQAGEFVTIDAAGPTGEVAMLTDAGVIALRLTPHQALDATSNIVAYVAFGLGQWCTMVGKSMIEAPVHFPEEGESPITAYNRFLLIYAIPASGPARLATVAAAHEEGLSGLDTHLNEFYETQQ